MGRGSGRKRPVCIYVVYIDRPMYPDVMGDLRFAWDPTKDRANRRKHGISFEEARSVFLDDGARIASDPDHSEEEDRFILLGQTYAGRLVIVVHTDRGENIRVISARLATRRERKAYEND